MDEQLYLVIFRKGMTGGTSRSVYKMLASSDEWNHLLIGEVTFFAAGIPVCHLIWNAVVAVSENEALAKFNKKAVNDDGYDIFVISYAEILRIDKGEEVNDPTGSILEETVRLINEIGDRSQFIEISKEELENQTRNTHDAT